MATRRCRPARSRLPVSTMSAARQRCEPRQFIARHVHRQGYVAIVLGGRYEEAGDGGLVRAEAGDVVFHGAYDGHLDRMGPKGAEILNLELPADFAPAAELGAFADPDQLARAAERDPREAWALLLDGLTAGHRDDDDEWPDRLARDLRSDPQLSIGAWCQRARLRPETVSRRFMATFGVGPRAFRAHARFRAARELIAAGRASLAEIAAGCGFADQSHMTRAVRAATGTTPRGLRAEVK